MWFVVAIADVPGTAEVTVNRGSKMNNFTSPTHISIKPQRSLTIVKRKFTLKSRRLRKMLQEERGWINSRNIRIACMATISLYVRRSINCYVPDMQFAFRTTNNTKMRTWLDELGGRERLENVCLIRLRYKNFKMRKWLKFKQREFGDKINMIVDSPTVSKAK